MVGSRSIRNLAFAFAAIAIAVAAVVPQRLASGGFETRCSVAAAPDGPCCCGVSGAGKCPKGCCRAARSERAPDEGVPARPDEPTSVLALPGPVVSLPALSVWTFARLTDRTDTFVSATPTLLSLGVRINA